MCMCYLLMYWLQCSAVTLDHLYLLTYVLVQFKGGFDDAVRAICIQTFHVKWPFPWQYMSNSLYISPAMSYLKYYLKFTHCYTSQKLWFKTFLSCE